MKVCVLSALYGDNDEIHEPAWQSVGAEWVLVSDRPRVSDTWRAVVEPRPAMENRLAARLPKCRPELYTDAEIVVWVDAQFEVVGNEFLAELIGRLENADVAMFPHPWLAWADEAEATIRDGRFDGHPIVEQAATFTDPGRHWASCVMARRMTPAVATFGRDWWDELCRWGSGKDQIALTPLLARHGVAVADIKPDYRHHAALVLHDHYWGPVRQRWEDLKAALGWRCPLCHAANWSNHDHCVNSWVSDGRRRGCHGRNPNA